MPTTSSENVGSVKALRLLKRGFPGNWKAPLFYWRGLTGVDTSSDFVLNLRTKTDVLKRFEWLFQGMLEQEWVCVLYLPA